MQGLGGVTSVKALTAVMYRDMKGWGGAYKLLNATGRIGSQGKHEQATCCSCVRRFDDGFRSCPTQLYVRKLSRKGMQLACCTQTGHHCANQQALCCCVRQ